MSADSIRPRMICNTAAHNLLRGEAPTKTMPSMAGRTFKFRELLFEAVKHNPSLLKEDGALNLTAIAAHYKKRGAPITQPNLYRLCHGNQKPGERVVNATYKVFNIPRYMLRGEPVSAEMDDLLTQFDLSMLLLAKKLASLPRESYQAISRQVDVMYEQQQEFRSLDNPKVTQLDRARRQDHKNS